MSWIIYSAETPSGDIVRRNGRFEDLDSLDQHLMRRGESMVDFFELPDALYRFRQWAFFRLRPLEVAECCQALSLSIAGGIDLQAALDDMERSASSLGLRQVAIELKGALANGYPLSRALELTTQFPPEVIALARVGEQSGKLDLVLRDAATYIERVSHLKSAALRAIIYPSFTLCVMIAGAMFWLSFVVPRIAEVFKVVKVKLPDLTQNLVAASEWMRVNWWLMLAILLALPTAFLLARRMERFRLLTDRIGWHLPIYGRITRASQMAYYFEYMGLMYGAGVAITQALETLTGTVQNRYFRRRVTGMIERLRSGTSLTEALERTRMFDTLTLRMVGVGETTGTLDAQLRRLGQMYSARVSGLIDVLAKVLEPLVLVLMAGMFILFVVGILGPIYETIGKLG